MNDSNNNNNNNDTPTSLFPIQCNIKPFPKGNAQFIFFCNPPKLVSCFSHEKY